MWQRFTERAKKSVFEAQEEAAQFGEGYVSTEHLLLGLLKDSASKAVLIIKGLGVSPDRLRSEVLKQLPRGESRPKDSLSLTPRAKRVIDLAYEEAKENDGSFIGTEHLLMGLIREGDGLAGRVLAKLGVELHASRRVWKALPETSTEDQAVPADPPKTCSDCKDPIDPFCWCQQPKPMQVGSKTRVQIFSRMVGTGGSPSPEDILSQLVSDFLSSHNCTGITWLQGSEGRRITAVIYYEG